MSGKWYRPRFRSYIPSLIVRSTPTPFPSSDNPEPRLFLADGETFPAAKPGEAGVTSWSMAVLRQVADRTEFRERVQRVRELQRRLGGDEATDVGLVEEIIMICHALNNEIQVEQLRELVGRKKR